MKKSGKKPNRGQTKKRNKAAAIEPTQPERRAFLGVSGNVLLGIGAASIAGVFGVRVVSAGMRERDLTRIGNGKPSVVQVHDPACPTCNALQKETRQALKGFGECDLQYLIADINTDDGARFAARHGVPHVTLVLLDGNGRMVDVLNGLRPSDELEVAFQSHYRTFGAEA